MCDKIEENIKNLASADLKIKVGYPLYYKENGQTIKELENGEKWVVTLDSNYKEVMVEQIK